MVVRKTFFNWSSGKDGALAIRELFNSERFRVEALLTTISAETQRISMHGVRRSLLEAQAHSLKLPLIVLELPDSPAMETYDALMSGVVQNLYAGGFRASAFGDIHLEDLRAYREKKCEEAGMEAVFPLWKRDTTALAKDFIDSGFRAIVVAADSAKLGRGFVGKEFDREFLQNLPDDVDPCGENGEFHTFCFDGPIFDKPVRFRIGESVYREYDSPSDKEEKVGFWFRDLLMI